MHIQNLKVIVVGGATGGAATALLLAKSGAHVTLLEKVANPRAVGAGIALAANGLAVLEAIGLGEAIDAASHEVGPARVVDARGRTLLDPAEPRPRIAMLRRSTLQELLLDAVTREPNITCQFGAEVTSVDRQGGVRVTTNGLEDAVEGDLIVGADGVHSRVRASGAFGATVAPPGITYVRGLAPAGLARGEEAWTSAGLFGSLEADGATYFYASAGSAACRIAMANRDLDTFRRAWAAAYPPADAMLGSLRAFDDLIVNRVLRVDCTRWHDGRIVLVGDAAHAMAPNLGQGANSALVDAAVLTDELRRATDLNAALAAYDARRRPAVKRVADLSGRLGRLAEQTNPVIRFLRDRLLLPVANRMASDRAYDLVLQERPEVLRTIRPPRPPVPASEDARDLHSAGSRFAN